MGAHAFGDEGNSWSREHPHQIGVAAHGGDACQECAFEHIAGDARILADDDPCAMPIPFQDVSYGLPDRKGHHGIHRMLVRYPPDPVGPKQSPHARASLDRVPDRVVWFS